MSDTELQDGQRGSLGFRPCDGCIRTNCADVCPSWPSDSVALQPQEDT